MKNSTIPFLIDRWKSVLLSVTLGLIFGFLIKLNRDGSDLFLLQKKSLSVHVFSQADLSSQHVMILEEKLRSLEKVDKVIPLSPEESLQNLLSQPNLKLNREWLDEKSRDMSGKEQILPWSYNLYLSQWDEPFLLNLTDQIKNLIIGEPPRSAVTDVLYDRERLSLVLILHQYLRWTSLIIKCLALILGSAFLLVFLRLFKNPYLIGKDLILKWFAAGPLCGISAHLLYLISMKAAFSYMNVSIINTQNGRIFLMQVWISSLALLWGLICEKKEY